MNIQANILRLTTVAAVCFLIVAGALGYWQLIQAPDLVARADNPRRLDEELKIQRGRILDRTGAVLAANEVGKEGYVRRTYAEPTLAHVIGFFNPRLDSAGLEKAFDGFLSGREGFDPLALLRNRIGHEPLVGNDVVLTIDRRLQKVAWDALGDGKGAVVALHPRTGEVLALVSKPGFDPNALVFNPNAPRWSVESQRVADAWQALTRRSDAPLLNRAAQGLYPPGSTFKTVTLAAALEMNVATPQTEFHYTLNPRDGRHTAAWHRNEYVDCQNVPKGDFDLTGAYVWSCNVTFSNLGGTIGSSAYLEFARRFGLEERPPIEIPAAASQLSRRPNYFTGDERFYALASTAMGQGELEITPLQMALIAAAPANDGVVPRPFLVREARRRDGAIIYRGRPGGWKLATSARVAAEMRDIMVESVETGYAKPGAVQGVKIAGKTGTAETGPGQPTHAWFIGFAPAENPTVAVAVVKEFGGAGGAQAGPIAKAVLEAALRP